LLISTNLAEAMIRRRVKVDLEFIKSNKIKIPSGPLCVSYQISQCVTLQLLNRIEKKKWKKPKLKRWK
jgi:hypothetical protein